MLTEELIEHARHAITTGQPRLAQLYMRKALEQVDQDRRYLDPMAWKRRRNLQAVKGLLQAFGEPLEQITAAAQAFMDYVVTALTSPTSQQQSDYTLLAAPGDTK